MRKQFKETILDLAQRDPKIVMILGDIGVYLFHEFKSKFPERFYNMGICENTLVSVAAGLSSQGLKPFVHTIAPFLIERSYEQIKVDMCYNRLSGNLVSCGASFDYAWDGASHHALAEMEILRTLPGVNIFQPGSGRELDTLLRECYNYSGVNYYRLSDHEHKYLFPVRYGRGVVLKDSSSDVVVMTAGPLLAEVFKACESLEVTLAYFHTIKPIDKDLIRRFRNKRILVIHDARGLYEAVCEVPELNVSYHGLRDEFLNYYGSLNEIRQKISLDASSIHELVKSFITHNSNARSFNLV